MKIEKAEVISLLRKLREEMKYNNFEYSAITTAIEEVEKIGKEVKQNEA